LPRSKGDFLAQIARPHQLEKRLQQLAAQGQHLPKQVPFHLVFADALLRGLQQPLLERRQLLAHAIHLEFHRRFGDHSSASLLRENDRMPQTQPMFSPRGRFCLRQFVIKPLQFTTSA
jgi:hypothetical protein